MFERFETVGIFISVCQDQVSIKPISTRLEQALSSLLAMVQSELVLILVLMCRALGFDTRIVINLSIPPKTETSKSSTKETVMNKDDSSVDESKREEKPSAKLAAAVRAKKGESSKAVSKSDKSKAKLAAAAKARKSKKINPDATEESIIKSIEDNADSDDGGAKSRTKSSKSKKESSDSNTGHYYWAEVFLVKEKRWIPVDMTTGKINNPSNIESRASKPVLYTLAVNSGGQVKDVTRRYCSNFLTQSRKLRVDQDWLDKTLFPWLDTHNKKEDAELNKKSEEAPLPTNVSAFKGHPLYVLQSKLIICRKGFLTKICEYCRTPSEV